MKNLLRRLGTIIQKSGAKHSGGKQHCARQNHAKGSNDTISKKTGKPDKSKDRNTNKCGGTPIKSNEKNKGGDG